MSRKYGRFTLWIVLVPLLLVAGLFWLEELQGYRSEVSVLVLPKQEVAMGAAGNLTAIASELSFATAVYEAVGPEMKETLRGITPTQRKALWEKRAQIRLVPGSDLIHIATTGNTSAEALRYSQVLVEELVRTASHYYNQKTDLDMRVVSEAVSISKATAWPRFVLLVGATALGFTSLFFAVYVLIGWLFPAVSRSTEAPSEYVISAETFRPRPPKYWNHEESASASESGQFDIPLSEEASVIAGPNELDTLAEPMKRESEESPQEWEREYEQPVSMEELFTVSESVPPAPVMNIESIPVPPEIPESSETDVRAEYYVKAAAPDNLPIVEGPISPLQGAQARLMKQDIDATAAQYASLYQPQTSEETSQPQTHEPSADEYRRRLNELLSGKM